MKIPLSKAKIEVIDVLERADMKQGDGVKYTAGPYEYVLFTLKDGSEIKVSLSGDESAVEIHNNGRGSVGLNITPHASNDISVRPWKL